MMTKRILIVGLLFLVFFCGVTPGGAWGKGAVFYVAGSHPGAGDGNNGLAAERKSGRTGPWKTIAHALAKARAGDKILIRQGIYFESGLVLERPGRPGAPITLAAHNGEKVVLDGSKGGPGGPGILIRGNGHYVIQGLVVRHMPDNGLATEAATRTGYRGITIRDCEFHGNGWSGVELAAVDGFLLENVSAHDNAFYGLNLLPSKDGQRSCANGRVVASRFFNHTGKEGHGLAVNQGHDIVVMGCTAHHNTIHGFDVSDWPKKGPLSHHILFEGNRSFDNGVSGFSINSDSHHVVYRRNAAWGNGADWAGRGSGSGFWCYEGCRHVAWLNNVSCQNTDSGFMVEGRAGEFATPQDRLLVFRNNVTYGNGRPQWDERFGLHVCQSGWDLVIEHNNWGGDDDPQSPVVGLDMEEKKKRVLSARDMEKGRLGRGNRSVEPGFVDRSGADWRLKPDSPLIDAGMDVGLPFCGRAPDMGAMEYCPK